MFLAVYKDAQGIEQSGLYNSFEDYYKDTFSPLCEPVHLINFVLSGRTYGQRKAAARDLAVKFSTCSAPGLSWNEASTIQSYFETIGRRYGLLIEFRENAIC